MQYRRLGRLGVDVSRLILGCGNFGGIGSAPAFYGQGESEADATALLDRAWAHGINTFDTADAYGGGRSETWIGRWLAAKGSRVRDAVVLSSKVFNPVGPGVNERGLSRVHVLRQIDASLKRLQTDRIDLYLMHEPDPNTPIEETLDAFDTARRAGKIHYAGVSNFEAWRLADTLAAGAAHGLPRVGWVQNSYSLLDRAAARDVLPLCEAEGLGFTPFSPLAGGWLTGKYRRGAAYPDGSRMTLRPEPYRPLESDAIFDAIEALEQQAAVRETTLATLSMAWVLADPRIDAIVIGPRSVRHLDAALGALEVPMDASDAARIAALVP
jgi:aryl-alcohol dehydrogenase-like predicted oxidoreductase